MQEESSNLKMFGPLVFNNIQCDAQNDQETSCLLCEELFNLQTSLPLFLKHIFDVHNIVIESVEDIDNFRE